MGIIGGQTAGTKVVKFTIATGTNIACHANFAPPGKGKGSLNDMINNKE